MNTNTEGDSVQCTFRKTVSLCNIWGGYSALWELGEMLEGEVGTWIPSLCSWGRSLLGNVNFFSLSFLTDARVIPQGGTVCLWHITFKFLQHFFRKRTKNMFADLFRSLSCITCEMFQCCNKTWLSSAAAQVKIQPHWSFFLLQCRMTRHQQCPTGPSPPQTSGTTWSTSAPSAPTTTSTSWRAPSTPTNTLETPWATRPTRDTSTETGVDGRSWWEEPTDRPAEAVWTDKDECIKHCVAVVCSLLCNYVESNCVFPGASVVMSPMLINWLILIVINIEMVLQDRVICSLFHTFKSAP